MKITRVNKSGLMSLEKIIDIQITMYCYLNKINISKSDIECMTLLCINGKVFLSDFCNIACEYEEREKDPLNLIEKVIFKTPQSVRNSLSKLEFLNLIIKEGKSKKKIFINPDLKIIKKGNILLEYKFLRKDETKNS